MMWLLIQHIPVIGLAKRFITAPVTQTELRKSLVILLR